MLQRIFELLPARVAQMPVSAAMMIAIAGLVLGLAGARFSRSILTLTLVAAGTYLGLHVPTWMGWGIDPMGPGFCGAIVLGLAGYMLSTLWEGLLLGLLLAGGAGSAVWILLAGGATWHWPQIDWSATSVEIVVKVWQSLPMTVNKAFPAAVGLGFGLGVLFVALWPKLGKVMVYSLLGMIILVLAGFIVAQKSNREMLRSLPVDPFKQGIVFGAMVLVAMVIQGLLLPRARKKRDEATEPKAKSDKEQSSKEAGKIVAPVGPKPSQSSVPAPTEAIDPLAPTPSVHSMKLPVPGK
jgi:hypothetical protein